MSQLNWWKKWVADLSSTRIQLTYLVAGLFAYTVLRAISLIRTVPEAVSVLGVLTGPFLGVLSYHMVGRWMDVKQNGTTPEAPKI